MERALSKWLTRMERGCKKQVRGNSVRPRVLLRIYPVWIRGFYV